MLFLTAAPAKAQSVFSIGAGSYLAQNQQDTLSFHYYVSQSSSGHVSGLLLFSGPGSTQLVDITSVMTLPNGAVALAGTVVWIQGTPPGGSTVGRGAFMAFQDSGPGFADRTTGYSLVPLAFPQNATIQQIVAAIGPPTAAQWRSLESGGVWIR
ncbi:MAG TPA: hypothetical protein VFZ65_23835 [Planctomycetota bacterium]|nr:hypothetical protein [Planctomycetota bacterium]